MKNILLASMIAFGLLAGSAVAQQQAPTPPGLSALGGYKALAVTATTGRTPISVAPSNAFPALTIVNIGDKDAYFALGGSTVVATTSSTKIAAGKHMTIWLGTATYVAAIAGGAETTTLDLYQASGTIYFGP